MGNSFEVENTGSETVIEMHNKTPDKKLDFGEEIPDRRSFTPAATSATSTQFFLPNS